LGDEEAEPSRLSREGLPRRPSDVLKIRILSVALVLVLVAFALYGLASDEFSDASEEPYPMEDTPLTLQSWGVTWSREFNELFVDAPFWAYADMSISLTVYSDDGSTGSYSAFSLGEFITVSVFSVPTTLDEAEDLPLLEHTTYYEDGVEVCSLTGYFVSDATNPEVFNSGDTVSFIHIVFRNGVVSSVGFTEDVVYEIELYCSAGGQEAREGYGIAVHDGLLYSWIDHGPIDDPLS
jgi:hypothetical protein